MVLHRKKISLAMKDTQIWYYTNQKISSRSIIKLMFSLVSNILWNRQLYTSITTIWPRQQHILYYSIWCSLPYDHLEQNYTILYDAHLVFIHSSLYRDFTNQCTNLAMLGYCHLHLYGIGKELGYHIYYRLED